MIDYIHISESLYTAAANSIRSLTEHYQAMLSAGVKPEDVLTRLVQHIDRINLSTADEASKTKAKSELLAFAKNNMLVSNQQEWDVVSGLFDDGWTPDGWIKESLDQNTTPSQAAGAATHVLYHANFNRFHGVVNGKSVKPMTEPELHRHLVRDHGYDKDTAAEMIRHFQAGNASGIQLHRSTDMVDAVVRHSGLALRHHLAGNYPMRNKHLKIAHQHMDMAHDTLKSDDAGATDHLDAKLRLAQNILKNMQ
jgi:hypothetical protein